MEISSGCESAVSRWRRQYIDEQVDNTLDNKVDNTLDNKVAITPEHQRIQLLEKQLK
jgi:transposase-like protein